MGAFSSDAYAYRVDRPYAFDLDEVVKLTFYLGDQATATYVPSSGGEFTLEVTTPPHASEDLPKRVRAEKIFKPLAKGKAEARVVTNKPSTLPLTYEVFQRYDLDGLIRALTARGLAEVRPGKLILSSGSHDRRLVATSPEVEAILPSRKVEVDYLLTPAGAEVFARLEGLIK